VGGLFPTADSGLPFDPHIVSVHDRGEVTLPFKRYFKHKFEMINGGETA
jgi:hypothetical protein